jgi:hypothetical protein
MVFAPLLCFCPVLISSSVLSKCTTLSVIIINQFFTVNLTVYDTLTYSDWPCLHCPRVKPRDGRIEFGFG